MVNAICLEISRIPGTGILPSRSLRSIYFGGGTPSVLDGYQLERLFETIWKTFRVQPNAEITLEANPEDLNPEQLVTLAASPINRLSLGIQSFRDEDLQWMNRCHTSQQALESVKNAQDAGFSNISLDLIYGIPSLDEKHWEQNILKALSLQPTHLSAYSLTVENGTVLSHRIKKGLSPEISDTQSEQDYFALCSLLRQQGYEHYEVSNFARPGYQAVHNASYWHNIPYVGVGPSAHSYIGNRRWWNISHNIRYMTAIEAGSSFAEEELLAQADIFNEYILTGLRSSRGINPSYISSKTGILWGAPRLSLLREFENKNWIVPSLTGYAATESGWLWSDFMASSLMEA
jgi:oxygen-independent coproporphyrinogen-3 oxidase